MKTYTVEVDGLQMTIEQDSDGKFIIPDGWRGIGTALKPAFEPLCLARKPLMGTVAANVLAHGTGALNIDGCRVDGEGAKKWETPRGGIWTTDPEAKAELVDNPQGRWPANVIHDGSEEVLAGFPETGPSPTTYVRTADGFGSANYRVGEPAGKESLNFGDSGSAARFFYSAKADSDDRLGSKHPTVKPVDLIAYLCRLITPPGGTVLDPFAGSGTTGMAAIREGFRPILIEREAEYFADACNRIRHIDGSDTPLFAMRSPQEAML